MQMCTVMMIYIVFFYVYNLYHVELMVRQTFRLVSDQSNEISLLKSCENFLTIP